jgi:predicted amidophosphoribosyltransferase
MSNVEPYTRFCKHCRMTRSSHANGKCLWMTTSFEAQLCIQCGAELRFFLSPFYELENEEAYNFHPTPCLGQYRERKDRMGDRQ